MVFHGIALWPALIRYWPIVLVAWGLFKLVEYFGRKGVEKQRPLFSARDCAAIVSVIVIGSLMTLAANMSPGLAKTFQIGDFDVWDLTGNNFQFTERHVMDAGPDSVIDISNQYGDVDVMPGEGNRITVDVRKTIRASGPAEAKDLSFRLGYYAMKDGSVNRIGGTFSPRLKASLTIHVPARSVVSIENRNGNVSLRGLTGNQTIANRYGSVEVHDVTGMVTIRNNSGHSD